MGLVLSLGSRGGVSLFPNRHCIRLIPQDCGRQLTSPFANYLQDCTTRYELSRFAGSSFIFITLPCSPWLGPVCQVSPLGSAVRYSVKLLQTILTGYNSKLPFSAIIASSSHDFL